MPAITPGKAYNITVIFLNSLVSCIYELPVDGL